MLIDQLAGEPEPCDAWQKCNHTNPDKWALEVCRDCRFAKRFPGLRNNWSPKVKGEKHPDVIASKLQQKWERQQERAVKKASIDRRKQVVLARAKKAEEKTNRNFIQATKNSGRSFRDADHVLAGRITLDTKSQDRLHPLIKLEEMDKVRSDARRAGNPYGALVMRNNEGRGFVVMAEEDFARLVKGMNETN